MVVWLQLTSEVFTTSSLIPPRLPCPDDLRYGKSNICWDCQPTSVYVKAVWGYGATIDSSKFRWGISLVRGSSLALQFSLLVKRRIGPRGEKRRDNKGK